MGRSTVRGAFGVFLLLVLVACGGGGGGGGAGGGGGGGGALTGSVTGRVAFHGGQVSVLEAEPNDLLSQTRSLGDLLPGRTMTVVGRVDAAAGDVLDAFRFRAVVRGRVTARLTYATGEAPDLDLAVYAPSTLQAVEAFDAPASPTTVTFVAKGLCDVVVHAASGASSYELRLSVEAASGTTEREPDATPGDEPWLGELLVGETVTATGTIDAADAVDAYLVACPAAMGLRVRCTVPAFSDFDVALLDATTDVAAPTPWLTFAARSGPEEVGTAAVPAGRLVRVEVRRFSGSGGYQLSLTGQVGTTSLAGPAEVRVASVHAERRRLHRTSDAACYGRAAARVARGQVLVRVEAGADDAATREAVTARAGRVVGASPAGLHRVDFACPEGLSDEDAARWTLARAAALAGADGVVAADPNWRRAPSLAPDDPYFDLQWGLAQVHAEQAWDVTTGAASTIVAVIDTGKTNHPQLAGRWTGGYDFVSDPAYSDDGNGRDADPADAYDPSGGYLPFFHGTFCAGIIAAATDDGVGVAGLTWATQILPLRALSSAVGGTDEDIIEAIYYAARLPNASGTLPAQRAHVINMSLGGPGYSQVFQDAITDARNAGCVIVAASGNEGTFTPSYPAGFAGVLSVGSVGYLKQRTSYSNYGSTLDLVAPGGDMAADRNGDGYPDGILGCNYAAGSGGPDPIYEFAEGTSFAAPLVAGAAALLLAVDATLTPAQVENAILSTTEDLGTPGRDDSTGWGLLDLHALFSSSDVVPPPSGPPVLVVSPTDVLFDPATSTLELTVLNGGGGTVNVGTLAVATSSGGAWLTATGVGPGDATRSLRGVRLDVNRTGLLPGSYFGTVTVPSDAGTVEVRVAVSVASGSLPPANVDVRVQAVRADTGQVVQETTVNPTSTLNWSFASLPAGDYFFFASTDLDGDGVRCEVGDYCGAYPFEGRPERVTVLPSGQTTNVDFAVAPRASLSTQRAP